MKVKDARDTERARFRRWGALERLSLAGILATMLLGQWLLLEQAGILSDGIKTVYQYVVLLPFVIGFVPYMEIALVRMERWWSTR